MCKFGTKPPVQNLFSDRHFTQNDPILYYTEAKTAVPKSIF